MRNLPEPLYDLAVSSISETRENLYIRQGIREGQVHLWKIDLDNPAAGPEDLFKKVLSDDEKERAKRLGLSHYRDRFVTARGYLRTILGRYLNISPESIEFEYNGRGKPGLPAGSNPIGIAFNISHSRNLALCAVGAGAALGVDIEYVRGVLRPERILERFFSTGEREWYRSSPHILKDRFFMRLWTLKEAYSKAVGTGFSSVLKDLDFSSVLTSSGDSCNLTILNEKWTIVQLDPGTGYIGALVRKGDVSEIMHFVADDLR